MSAPGPRRPPLSRLLCVLLVAAGVVLGAGPVAAGAAEDPVDLVYVNVAGDVTVTTGASGAVASGNRTKVTLRLPGPWTAATLTRLGALPDALGAPLPVNTTSTSPLVTFTGGRSCAPTGSLDAWRATWTPEGGLATLSAVLRVSCGGRDTRVVVSQAAPRALLPALPHASVYPLSPVLGTPIVGNFTITNLGGQATGFGPPQVLPDSALFQPKAWSVGACDPQVLEPGGTCTLSVGYQGAPDVLDTQARVVLTSDSAEAPGPSLALRIRAVPITTADSPVVSSPLGPNQVEVGRTPAVPFTVTNRVGQPITAAAQCRLDRGRWAPCTSPWRPATALGAGPHVLDLLARDTAGRWSYMYTVPLLVDAVPPPAAVLDPLPAVALATIANLRWSAPGAVSVQVVRRTSALGGPFTAWTTAPGLNAAAGTTAKVALPAGSTTCVMLRGRDRAGNLGPWSAQRCVSVPLDDRGLTPTTSAWSRAADAGAWAGTVTTAARAGAVLRGPSASGHRFAVVATTCPTCGVVDLTVGSTRIGRIDLRSSATTRRVVKLLPARSTAAVGPMALTTVTAGTVPVDGVIVVP